MGRDVTDFRFSCSTNARATLLRVETQCGAEPHFHEVGGPQNDGFHAAGKETSLAIALCGRQDTFFLDIAGVRSVDEPADSLAFSRVNQRQTTLAIHAPQAVLSTAWHGRDGGNHGPDARARGEQSIGVGQVAFQNFNPGAKKTRCLRIKAPPARQGQNLVSLLL